MISKTDFGCHEVRQFDCTAARFALRICRMARTKSIRRLIGRVYERQHLARDVGPPAVGVWQPRRLKRSCLPWLVQQARAPGVRCRMSSGDAGLIVTKLMMITPRRPLPLHNDGQPADASRE
jgi:hypothetical protein